MCELLLAAVVHLNISTAIFALNIFWKGKVAAIYLAVVIEFVFFLFAVPTQFNHLISLFKRNFLTFMMYSLISELILGQLFRFWSSLTRPKWWNSALTEMTSCEQIVSILASNKSFNLLSCLNLKGEHQALVLYIVGDSPIHTSPREIHWECFGHPSICGWKSNHHWKDLLCKNPGEEYLLGSY